MIQPQAHAIHLVSGPHLRLARIEEFQSAFTHPILEETIAQGIQNALQAINPKREVVVIAGSFFIMDEAREALRL